MQSDVFPFIPFFMMIDLNRNLMGCILSPPDARDLAYAIHPVRPGEEVTIPETFSLREKQTSVK